METVWGLDLGTTSVGFAVIRREEATGTGEIVRSGTRIFPEGVNESDLKPRNADRRTKRLHRRQLRRRRVRRVELSRMFREWGLLPVFGSEEWHTLMKLNPYELRKRGVDQKLSLLEFGRALYHLAQRRGFQSNRRDVQPVADEKDLGEMKEKIEALEQQLQGQTLGEFLATQDTQRGRHLDRKMVLQEFERLWSVQRELHQQEHPALFAPEREQVVKELVFFQRPVFWRLSTLGTCRLLPGSKLCLKGSWLGQQYLLLQDLNSLRLEGSNEPLPADERELLLQELLEQGELSWAKCRKALKSSWKKRGIPPNSKFNLEIGGKNKLTGNLVVSNIRRTLDTQQLAEPVQEQLYRKLPEWHFDILYREVGQAAQGRVIMRSTTEISQQEALYQRRLQQEFQLPAEVAEKLVQLEFPSGWLSHSVAAIEKLLPYLQQGLVYSAACDIAFPAHREVAGEGLEFLPSDQSQLADVRNPTVKRALNELRKVTNNLLRTYGKPDRIRVELARELKMPSSKRKEYQQKNNKREKERTAAANAIRAAGYRVNALSIEKYLLWQEAEERCLYTNRPISFAALFEEGQFEIEHILPYSLTLNNGFMNKTLCEREFNGYKSNRIPYEAFQTTGEPERWKQFVDRVKKSKLPDAKKRRLVAKSIEDLGADFSERQLRDTAYIAREARDFLLKLYTKEEGKALPVETSNGMITAQLRQLWGLNSLLAVDDKKNRDDHRHHALDAAVVALVTPGVTRQMNLQSQYWLRGERIQFPPPWPNFRADLGSSLSQIIVSHKVRAKVNGPLHNELVYGRKAHNQSAGSKGSSIYHRRVKLQSLSDAQIKRLKAGTLDAAWDDGRRLPQLLQAHLAAHKDFSTLPSFLLPDGSRREIKSIVLLEKKKDQLMENLDGEGKTYAEKQENHHMAVFEDGDGKIKFEVTTRLDAAKKMSKEGMAVSRHRSDGFRFKFSLVLNDSLMLRNGDGTPEVLVVKSIWDSGNLVLKPHWEAGNKTRGINKTISILVKEGWEKCAVDPIGRLKKKND